MKNLGSTLKTRRIDMRMTLREVEKKTHISNAYLSQLENGKIFQPTPKILRDLSVCYDIPYPELLDLAGHPIFAETSSIKSKISTFDNLSINEERELKKYLEFLRSKGNSI